jgi:shikimate dehydrogenase
VLSGATRLVGLLGDPVSGSLSPRMQNAAFAARGLDWAYVPLPVDAAGLADAVRGLVAQGFAGANVTVPHKTAVAPLCDELDDVAERAGSVNTLVVRDGRVLGSSTDGLAVAWVVRPGDHALILGAGGAARAVAPALLDAGAESVAVAARREAAAAEFAASSHGVEVATEKEPADVVVNATPVRDEVLVTLDGVRVVVDLAYRQDGRATALVEAAGAAGIETVDGLEVLVRQGAASFERWTGIEAPVDVMRAAVRPGP